MKDFEGFISHLKEFIAIDSVTKEATKNAPFGEGVKKALNYILDLAKSFGFTTINYDNYAGEIIYGEGEEIGIIGHVDVVPAGNGWDSDPFTLTYKDNAYFGRGTSDDKTPLLLVLYILKELKDKGIKFNRKIRLIIGCDEETNWKDLEYLLTKTTLPEYGVSPDGSFPLSYAEKGVEYVYLYLDKFKHFTNLKGGTVINAVCGEAEVTALDGGIDEVKLNKHGLILNGNRIISIGQSAHGSHPEMGKNAFLPLFNYMLEMGEDVQNFIDCVFNDKYGFSKIENEQGIVTLSPDIIKEENGKVKVYCDCRIPAPAKKEDVIKVLDKFNIPYEIIEKHPPLLVEKDGWFVNAMLDSYNKVMKTNASPISMGGSTFARAFKKGCSFGVEFEDDNPHMHEPNERISQNCLDKTYEIYYDFLTKIVK